MLQMCYPQLKSCLTCNNFLKALHIQRLGRKRKPLLQPPFIPDRAREWNLLHFTMTVIAFYDSFCCITFYVDLYYILRQLGLLHFTTSLLHFTTVITFYDDYYILRQHKCFFKVAVKVIGVLRLRQAKVDILEL